MTDGETEVEEVTMNGQQAGAAKPILVGVDGSDRNQSAIGWAVTEASSAGCGIELVTVIEHHVLPLPHFPSRHQEDHANQMLDDLRQRVQGMGSVQAVSTSVGNGNPVDVLLERASQARMVVVGKRGLGGFARALVGSNSIAVAGRAPVPVAIVPHGWTDDDHRGSPVVLGIDPYRPEDATIELAFRRAERLQSPLVAVHGWEAPTVYSPDAAAVTNAIASAEEESHDEFDKVVDSWRDRFPEVEVQTIRSESHPAMAVLDAAENARLTVLGRHVAGSSGFGFGSVTRAVLHYSKCPVIVVPAEPQ